jgi:choline monooxygenase
MTALPPFARPLTNDPTTSFTLPARWYTDPEVYEREKKAIFYKTWHYVGHTSQVAKPGDYVTGRIADQRVFVIRGRDGQLRAFHNVCQHRGHHLLQGAGNVALFVTCPYHAWAYDTEGKLRTARNCDHLKDFRKEEFGLPPIKVQEFCGFLFVNLDPKAAPMADIYVDLEADIRGRIPDLDRMRPARDFLFGGGSIKANWKVVVDNYVECYHCAPSHPAFAEVLDMDRYRQDDHGSWSRQIGLRTQANRTIYAIDADDPMQDAGFWYLWPTTTINYLPGKSEMNVTCVVPHDHAVTAFAGHQYSSTGAIDEQRFDYVMNILGKEDMDLCESVQEGLHSLGFDQGRIVADAARSGISEHALHRFHLLVRQALEG